MNPVATTYSDTKINRYHRSSLRVTKQLRWLQLAEIEYCRVTNAPSSSSSLATHSFLKWEVAQRTTPSSTVEEESGNGLSGASSSSSPHKASAVEIMAIVTDHRINKFITAQQDQDATPPLPPQGPPPTPPTTGKSLSSSSPPSSSPHHSRTYLVLVSQYRPPIDAISLEFPAGLVDLEDASPAVTAAREMKEETGYRVTIPKALQGGGGGGNNDHEDPDEMLAYDDEDATVTHVTTTPLSYDPGLTDSLFHMVKMKVHLRDDVDRGGNVRNTTEDNQRHQVQQQRAASNCDPVPELDGEEDIVVHLLPLWITNRTNTTNIPPPPPTTIASRLEGLRVQLGPRTVVMGNVHSYVEGIDQARSMLI